MIAHDPDSLEKASRSRSRSSPRRTEPDGAAWSLTWRPREVNRHAPAEAVGAIGDHEIHVVAESFPLSEPSAWKGVMRGGRVRDEQAMMYSLTIHVSDGEENPAMLPGQGQMGVAGHHRRRLGVPWIMTRRGILLLCLCGVAAATPATACAEDMVEFLNGSTLRGTMKQVRKDKQEFDFEATLDARTIVRTYSYREVHAVTMNGKRYVLNERPASTVRPRPSEPTDDRGGAASPGPPGERIERTREEVQALIDTVGRTPPDWFEATPLNYPRTLDLSWPDPGKDEWNDQKFLGQYVWNIINPNPGKWREGIRLLHHVVAVNKDNPAALKKALNQLGTLYCSLLEDWPRAAFWWQKAGSGTGGGMGQGGFRVGYEVGLARCYWELGNREMAVEVLERVGGFNSGAVHLWAELGEHDRALQMAQRQAQQYPPTHLICGDICRHAGKYDEALVHYRKVAALQDREKYGRAIYEANDRILGLQAQHKIDLSSIRDGVYRASSLGYAGLLEVAVTVRKQRITAVRVVRHEEKQYYSSFTDVENQIIQKQSVQGIDATSGATITAEAIISAAAKALGQGTR